ncbi:hypothetical protein [Sphingobacterium faecium]|jgi:hypothetical protein|uniref:hypothetical protein n=1 Tax=Sphingobacterium faecium TaxID=34087 RepID=UPI00320A3618
MENRILLDNNIVQPEVTDHKIEQKQQGKPNLFQGRTETVPENTTFPNWDIVPPNQFINPRIKQF